MTQTIISVLILTLSAAQVRSEVLTPSAMSQLIGTAGPLKVQGLGIPAGTWKDILQHPPKGQCPDTDALAKNDAWVQHSGGTPPGRVMTAHFAYEYAGGAGMSLTPRNRPHSWLWLGGHTNQGWKFRGTGPIDAGCFVIGTVAYYADNWPPTVDFLNKGETEERNWHETGAIRLLELRWYEPADGRRHRWYNTRRAAEMGWPAASPLPLPMPINSLY